MKALVEEGKYSEKELKMIFVELGRRGMLTVGKFIGMFGHYAGKPSDMNRFVDQFLRQIFIEQEFHEVWRVR